LQEDTGLRRNASAVDVKEQLAPVHIRAAGGAGTRRRAGNALAIGGVDPCCTSIFF
jgi:hypothetical protein